VGTAGRRFDEQHASLAWIDRAKVAAQRVARQLGDLAGHLDAGRPGADHDDPVRARRHDHQ
jgi:hypothetical protein